ncbi:MAG: anti-sigma factor antagonist [Frankiales bacterium]|nr:anti-sigma factor antagonist [Frankiales bacterium]
MTVEPLPQQGRVRVLRATGELDVMTSRSVLPALPEMVEGAAGVVLDVSAVTFFDSSGLRLVDRLARACGGQGAQLRVVAPPGTMARRVLEIAGMVAHLVEDDLASAVAAVEP